MSEPSSSALHDLSKYIGDLKLGGKSKQELEDLVRKMREPVVRLKERTKRHEEALATRRSEHERSSTGLREALSFISLRSSYMEKVEMALLKTENAENAALLKVYAEGFTVDEISQLITVEREQLRLFYLELPDVEDRVRRTADDIEEIEQASAETRDILEGVIKVLDECEGILAEYKTNKADEVSG